VIRWAERFVCRCVALLVAVSIGSRADAQETQLDLHGSFAVGTTSHSRSWGAGAAAQVTFGSSASPVKVSASPGFDYMKQEDGGPSQEILSLDVSLQPGGSSTITPYLGGSASANWSSGTGKQWAGSKLGLETMGGLQIKAGDTVTLKAEERFGYVKGQEHTLTTRVGVLVKL
jgi:hypothetical protein